MKTTQLQAFNIYALNNEDTYGIARTTVEIAAPVKEKLDTTSLAAYTLLNEKSNLLGNRVKQEKYKHFTREISALNKECDQLLSEMKKRIFTAAASIADPVLAEKAKTAAAFFESYKNLHALPQNTQFQLTDEMLAKLAKNETMTAIFNELGNDKVIALLTQKNKEFANKWIMRNDLLGDQKELPSATASSRDTSKAYTLFCNALINLQTLAPTPEMKALINDINAVRAKYAAIANAAKKDKKKNEDENPKTQD